MSKGIGRLLEIALTALETGRPMEKVQNKKGEMVWPWANELRGHAGPTEPPNPGRVIGSANFGPVANLCEEVQGHLEGDAIRRERAAGWQRDWYRRQGPGGDLGFMYWEPLSTTYEEPHTVAASIAYARGIEEAGPFLERMLALGLIHRCPNGRIVAASTRAGKNPKHWALEDFVRLSLNGRDGRSGKPSLLKRAFALKGGWRAPDSLRHASEFRDPHLKAQRMNEALNSIRFASGPLVVTHHENGHVSRFETGPICYASPVPAAVVCYEPWRVEYASFPGNSAKPFTELRTEVRLPDVFVHHGKEGVIAHLDISDLGPVVAEIRFEEVKRG